MAVSAGLVPLRYFVWIRRHGRRSLRRYKRSTALFALLYLIFCLKLTQRAYAALGDRRGTPFSTGAAGVGGHAVRGIPRQDVFRMAGRYEFFTGSQ